VRAHARRGAVAPAHASARRAAPAVSASAKQMDTEWNTVRVMENTVVCEEHRYFVVNVGTTAETGSLCDAYRVPGMYVQVREGEGGKPGFFALSCAPNIQGVFEFLVKETEGTAWLAAKRAGDSVQMSPIMGKGFPISTRLQLLAYPALPEERAPTDIIMFATGSGIAPIRAAIESRLNGVNPAQRKSVKLYYGARYPERMAYRDRFKLWESDRVEVIPVMSRPEGAKEPWTGRTGYVQDAFRADGIANPAKTGVILCGVKGMVEDVTKICLDAGVDKDRILTNF
jgi:sulfhydrogenase subunit gamma (sulfur reductase)